MAQPPNDPSVLAGSGGVVLGEARTNHEGRRALLLVRGVEDTTELRSLAETMGITIVETVVQSGHDDPRTYFGKGRLEDIADERNSTVVAPPATSSAGVLSSANTSGLLQTNTSNTSSTADMLVSDPIRDLHSFYHVQFSSLMVLAGATFTVRTL